MAEALTDESLVRRIRKGEHAMFGTLLGRYSQRLLNYLFRLCGDADDAQDCLQETCLRAWSHLDSYDDNRPFRPWIYRIATNAAWDLLGKRRGDLSLDRPVGDEDGSATLLDMVPDERELPETRFAERELAARLAAEIARLPEKMREAFVLFHQESFSYQEIAEALAIPVGTVKSRLHHACRKLYLGIGEGTS